MACCGLLKPKNCGKDGNYQGQATAQVTEGKTEGRNNIEL
jgi:hypothetical protein